MDDDDSVDNCIGNGTDVLTLIGVGVEESEEKNGGGDDDSSTVP